MMTPSVLRTHFHPTLIRLRHMKVTTLVAESAQDMQEWLQNTEACAMHQDDDKVMLLRFMLRLIGI